MRASFAESGYYLNTENFTSYQDLLLRDISMEIMGNKLSKELTLREGIQVRENSPADSAKGSHKF